MATPNGEVKTAETAESFARDYLEDLFSTSKNLGAFEEETLDINIKSKYDDIAVEETEENNTANVASFSVETVPAKEQIAEDPLEPGHDTFQTNGHASSEESVSVKSVSVESISQNGDIESSDVLEPGQSQFTSQNGNLESSDVLEPGQSQYTSQNGVLESSDVLEPGQSQFTTQSENLVEQVNQPSFEPEAPSATQFESKSAAQEEEEEEQDVVAPIPMSRGKATKSDEDEIADLQFKKLGLSKNWWDSKRNESETQKDPGQPVDKFRTIKQNIRKGNTRSLLARFEKLTE